MSGKRHIGGTLVTSSRGLLLTGRGASLQPALGPERGTRPLAAGWGNPAVQAMHTCARRPRTAPPLPLSVGYIFAITHPEK